MSRLAIDCLLIQWSFHGSLHCCETDSETDCTTSLSLDTQDTERGQLHCTRNCIQSPCVFELRLSVRVIASEIICLCLTEITWIDLLCASIYNFAILNRLSTRLKCEQPRSCIKACGCVHLVFPFHMGVWGAWYCNLCFPYGILNVTVKLPGYIFGFSLLRSAPNGSVSMLRFIMRLVGVLSYVSSEELTLAWGARHDRDATPNSHEPSALSLSYPAQKTLNWSLCLDPSSLLISYGFMYGIIFSWYHWYHPEVNNP